MRVFLGGDLRSRLFELLDEARGHIYAALFELSDEAILTKLKKLKSRAHIVLSNGTHKSRTDDENTEARADLVESSEKLSRRLMLADANPPPGAPVVAPLPPWPGGPVPPAPGR